MVGGVDLTLAAFVPTPNELLDAAFEQVAGGGPAAVVFGLAAGVVLSLNPVALPALPAVAAVVSPWMSPGAPRPVRRTAPVVGAFVVGMDLPLSVAGYVLTSLAVVLARASVVLSLLAAAVLSLVGLRLLLRRRDGCAPRRTLPTHPADAFAYGVLFSITACSGCAPLLLGLGSAVALVAGPVDAALALGSFLLARTAVLVGTAALGGRLLARPGGGRLLDVVVGTGLLLTGAYYAYLVATGRVSPVLPGERGSTVLP